MPTCRRSRSWPAAVPSRVPMCGMSWVVGGPRRFRVAYAQDEAFGGYFPDTIESLEALGADLVEFSPLRDEALPEGVGLVMIGCGLPDHHAEELASNLSMMAALGQHVCLGRRHLLGGGRDRLPGAQHDRRRPPVSRCRHPAVRRRADRRHAAAGPGLAPAAARLVAGTAGHARPRLQERPMAADPGPRAVRMPRLLRPALRRGGLVLPPPCRRQLAAPPPRALPEVVAAFAGPHRPSLKRPTARGLAERDSDRNRGYDLDRMASRPRRDEAASLDEWSGFR